VTDFNQLAAPRFADGVRRLLGEDIQVATVAPELAPYMSLESDRPEWQVLWAEIPIVGWRTQAAVAAQFQAVGAWSGAADRLLVITKIIIINQTAGALIYRVGMVAPLLRDTFSVNASRDLRRLGVVSQSYQRSQAGQQLSSVQGLPVPANSFVTIDVPWMLGTTALGPSGVIVEGDVVNQVVRAGFFGYERALRPEETQID